MNRFLILIYLFLSFQLQSQWLQKKGEGSFKLGVWSIVADEHFTSDGLKDPNATRGFFNTNIYAQYGISDQLTLVAYIPFFVRNYQNRQVSATTGEIIMEGQSENNFGDIDLGVEIQLARLNNVLLSASLTLGIPTGQDAGGNDGSYQTGDGEFNQLAQIHAGISFNIGQANFYNKFSVGFNQRSNGFSDELQGLGELGMSILNKKGWLIARLSTKQSVNNGRLDATNSEGSIFANNVEYTNIGAEGVYNISNKWGVSLGYSYPLSGKIIYAAPALSGGLLFSM